MKGRPPKPVERHLAEGTHRPDRHAALPVVVGGREALRPPRGMPKAEAAAFRQIAKVCASVLDSADAGMVEAAASMLVRARDARADIARRGILVDVVQVNRDGFEATVKVVNPAVRIERDAWSSFRLLAEQLGIGPSSRARLAGLGTEGRSAEDDFDELAALRDARRAGSA